MTEDQIKAIKLSEKPTSYRPGVAGDGPPKEYAVEGLPNDSLISANVRLDLDTTRWVFQVFPPELKPPPCQTKEAALERLKDWLRCYKLR